ncbi:unnamed protein product [Scytosiphon promiscuus]
MPGGAGSPSVAAVSEDHEEATTPESSAQTVIKGAAAAGTAAGIASGIGNGRGSKTSKSRAEEGEKGGTARSMPLPFNRTASASSSPQQDTRRRRAERRAGLDVEDDGDWPGYKLALEASREESAAATGRVEGRSAHRTFHGTGGPELPASQNGMEMEGSAQPRLMARPLFSEPPALGSWSAPRPRRAATQARHRISSMSSRGASSVGLSRRAVSAGPSGELSAVARGAEAEAAAGESEEEGACDGENRGNRHDGEEVETMGRGNKKQATTTKAKPSSGSAGSMRGVRASAAKKSKRNGKDIVTGNDGGGRGEGPAGASMNDGGGTGYGEATGHDGSTHSRQNDGRMLQRLDRRIFRFFRAAECQEDGCVEYMQPHCHRGPACDCTSYTYSWPFEFKRMLQHQAKHFGWTTRPAFGKRVMVDFSDGKCYPGTINTDGNSLEDLSHPKGRWGVLFDDHTADRFEDGDRDVMLCSRSRLKSIPAKLRDFYLKQENGPRLLNGVQVVAEGKVEAGDEEGQGYDEEQNEANPEDAKANTREGNKKRPRKCQEHETTREVFPERGGEGGDEGRGEDTTRKRTVKESDEVQASSSSPKLADSACGASGSKSMRKYAIAAVGATSEVAGATMKKACVGEGGEETDRGGSGSSSSSTSGFKRVDRSKEGAESKKGSGKRKKGGRCEDLEANSDTNPERVPPASRSPARAPVGGRGGQAARNTNRTPPNSAPTASADEIAVAHFLISGRLGT